MRARQLGITLAAALLYVGPFLAGLSAAPAPVLPVFVAVFTLWIAAMRPRIWSVATSRGTPVGLALHLGGVTLVQALLVIICFGLGRGFAGILGAPLGLPLWLPPLLSIAALPLARLFWTPMLDSPAVDAFLDEATAAMEKAARETRRP